MKWISCTVVLFSISVATLPIGCAAKVAAINYEKEINKLKQQVTQLSGQGNEQNVNDPAMMNTMAWFLGGTFLLTGVGGMILRYRRRRNGRARPLKT